MTARLALAIAVLIGTVFALSAAPAQAVPAATGKYYVVGAPVNGQREYLYAIALKTLGDGNRFREIVALNTGRTQPDGDALDSDGEIKPGWVLVLPVDAAGEGVQDGPLPAIAPVAAPSLAASPPPQAAAPEPAGTTSIAILWLIGFVLMLMLVAAMINILHSGARAAATAGARGRSPAPPGAGDPPLPPGPPGTTATPPPAPEPSTTEASDAGLDLVASAAGTRPADPREVWGPPGADGPATTGPARTTTDPGQPVRLPLPPRDGTPDGDDELPTVEMPGRDPGRPATRATDPAAPASSRDPASSRPPADARPTSTPPSRPAAPAASGPAGPAPSRPADPGSPASAVAPPSRSTEPAPPWSAAPGPAAPDPVPRPTEPVSPWSAASSSSGQAPPRPADPAPSWPAASGADTSAPASSRPADRPPSSAASGTASPARPADPAPSWPHPSGVDSSTPASSRPADSSSPWSAASPARPADPAPSWPAAAGVDSGAPSPWSVASGAASPARPADPPPSWPALPAPADPVRPAAPAAGWPESRSPRASASDAQTPAMAGARAGETAVVPEPATQPWRSSVLTAASTAAPAVGPGGRSMVDVPLPGDPVGSPRVEEQITAASTRADAGPAPARPSGGRRPTGPRPPLPGPDDRDPVLRETVLADEGPAGVHLAGVATGRDTPPYGWLAEDDVPLSGAVPLVLGRRNDWWLHVDLSRTPDCVALVGAAGAVRRQAEVFARRLHTSGVGVYAVGPLLGEESVPGLVILDRLPDPPAPGVPLPAPRVVFCTGADVTGAPAARTLASATAGRIIPILLGPGESAAWTIRVH
ncbi:hypothetical protein [Catenuloplanes indicus]|uniref:Basic proline-rich protein n=1 Tax=Catenuloplanes indicus TaxID=137267 RepID=A0AAE3W5L5_9ACTN|nr:hypothetical protein [Catenuloplanes indicus]MDQ0369996.1 hypothetical protein [Catenuloplanes indicus]